MPSVPVRATTHERGEGYKQSLEEWARYRSYRPISRSVIPQTQGELTADQEAYLDRLGTLDEASTDAYWLTREFARMVRKLEGEKLDERLKKADGSEVTVMQRFAKSLEKDLLAVWAGLTESWSNGAVECFIHKLKLIKRSMYGRASFRLLRQRVLKGT